MDKKRKAAASKESKDMKQDVKKSKEDAKNSKGNSQTRSKANIQSQSMADIRKKRDVASDMLMRGSLTAPIKCKTCYFYKDDDVTFAPIKIAVHGRKYKKLDILLLELSRKIPGLPFGVQSLYTPEGRDCIRTLDGLTDDASYICSAHRHYAKGLDVSQVKVNLMWRNATRPASGKKQLNAMLSNYEFQDSTPKYIVRNKDRAHDLATAYTKNTPKKITVMQNGHPSIQHILLLNRKTAQTFEQIMKDISDLFTTAVQKLYRVDGIRVSDYILYYNVLYLYIIQSRCH